MSRRLLLVAALALTPSLALAAPSMAWTAAKKVHPDAPILAGIDVASAASSESFKKFFPVLLAKQPEAKKVLDRLQKECSFDPFTAINSIVVAMDDSNDQGAFYIALNPGWDAPRVGECAVKIAKTEKKQLEVGPTAKGIQELTMVGKDEKLYLGWLGKSVLVFATQPTDRDFVSKMMTGKGAGAAGKLAKKLDTGATVWFAAMKQQTLPGGAEMKAMYATVKIANANVAADMRMITGNKKQAADLVTQFNAALPAVEGQLPPAAVTMVKSMKVMSSGPELRATASTSEKDLVDLVGLLMLGKLGK